MLKPYSGDDVALPDPMRDRIDRLMRCVIFGLFNEYRSLMLPNNSRTWAESAEKVRKIGSKHYVKRLVGHDDDTRAVAGQVASLTWSIQSFVVRLSMLLGHIALTVARQAESTLAIEFALDVSIPEPPLLYGSHS